MFLNKARSGWVLWELLLALSICGILATLSIGSLRTWLVDTTLQSLRYRVVALLDTAREAAYSMHEPMVLCASRTGRTCEGSWTAGQLVQSLSGHGIVTALGHLPVGYTLRYAGSFGHNAVLNVLPDGNLEGPGSFYVCALTKCVRIVVLTSGRTRVE
ncbi:MAG: hypothetical protein A3J38_08330 [Gammaproteobacteria bacterium RIFCSPHIGHO2_12_FULL_45_9]|nr:MAG: hypothetical protein A3J38_08330 [Gammaproteobacteria bacterium RIFCSPHIGHO2_12_FULL_45_9]